MLRVTAVVEAMTEFGALLLPSWVVAILFGQAPGSGSPTGGASGGQGFAAAEDRERPHEVTAREKRKGPG